MKNLTNEKNFAMKLEEMLLSTKRTKIETLVLKLEEENFEFISKSLKEIILNEKDLSIFTGYNDFWRNRASNKRSEVASRFDYNEVEYQFYNDEVKRRNELKYDLDFHVMKINNEKEF